MGLLGLISALGLRAVPVAVDDEGPLDGDVGRAVCTVGAGHYG